MYYVDLPDCAEENAKLLAAVRRLHGERPIRRTQTGAAWTGDVHAAEQIQHDPAFGWITAQIERHAVEYLKSLGHDVRVVDLFIQRGWPVVSSPGQYVGRHAHHTAHVSAVYYVSVPKEGNPGRLRFFNDFGYNHLAGGLGTPLTNAYATANLLNFQTTGYAPVEGRLVLFPAKQTHDVEANESTEDRVSLSFDLVMTSREELTPGYYEFLMPPPSQWKKCRRVEELAPEAAPESAHSSNSK